MFHVEQAASYVPVDGDTPSSSQPATVLCTRYRLPPTSRQSRILGDRTRTVAGRAKARLGEAQDVQAPSRGLSHDPSAGGPYAGASTAHRGPMNAVVSRGTVRKPRATCARDMLTPQLSENLQAALRIRRARTPLPWSRMVAEPKQ